MFVNDVFVKRGKQAQVFNFIQIFLSYDGALLASGGGIDGNKGDIHNPLTSKKF